jgi:formylglycine-generating enzyme required for sulfatase activity
MEFVRIQPGEFMMGCSTGDNQCRDDENPPHRVRITMAFEIGKYEVTQAQWESVMGTNPSYFKGVDHPVECVSWTDVQAFFQRLNARGDGHRYRLPTEAEWEYAARAGSTGPYFGSLDAIAWYGNNSGRTPIDASALRRSDPSKYGQRVLENGGQTHPVGQMQPNAWGLYDTLGNVGELVQDWYGDKYYAMSPESDPSGPFSGQTRGVRGGVWDGGASVLRVSVRYMNVDPDRKGITIGFRCVSEAIP